MTPTPAQLADEIEALAKEAFGGDWTVCVEEFGPHKGAVYIHAHDVDADEDGLARDYGRRICDMADNEDDEANAAFIAFCHQHKRAIVSALREASALKEEVEKLRAQDWQPIETAPKTDPVNMRALPFLGWCPDKTAPLGGDIRVVWWEPLMQRADETSPRARWYGDRDMEERPTHWRPLPAPPSDAALGDRKSVV